METKEYTEIDSLLQKIVKYLKDKVLKGDYEFIEVGMYTATLLIDNKYKIEIWIANGPKYINFYKANFEKLLADYKNGLLKLETEEEKIKVWEDLKPLVEKYKKEHFKKEKENEIKELEEKLKKIKEELKKFKL